VAVRGKHGALLAGRYRLLEQLGEGGMGSVWKAEHLLLHSHVAIKIIDPEVARLEFNLTRFLREAKTLASLRSRNVVQVLDFGSDGETPYLVMELLQGQTLGRRVSERGRLSLSETSGILQDVCAAMSLVHDQGLIHRDLKPDNIFLCNTGDQRVSKVVDFGIAKSLRGDMSTSMKTRTGHMLGTPSYMSPEQCRGLKDIDHRADLWALGVITYECLVGKVPFQGEVLGDLLLRICMDPLPVPSQHARGLPSTFDAWFAKAVSRDRSTRFQSALELAASLAELSSAASMGATVAAREVIEPSRPSAPRPAGGPASTVTPSAPSPPTVTPIVPSTTETNTTIGVGAGSGRRVERRARILAVASLAACALAGLWAIGNKPDAAGSVGVDVQTLRPAYEVTPKVIRPGVPSGRRWTTSPPAATGEARGAGDVGLRGGGGLAAIAAATAASVPSALSPDASPSPTLPAHAMPPNAMPPNAMPAHAMPSRAIGSSSAGHAPANVSASSLPGRSAASGEANPGAAGSASASPQPKSPQPSSPAAGGVAAGPAPPKPGDMATASPAPATAAPARAPTPPLPLRGTAATSTPPRAGAPSSEAGIRGSR
jgi:serine/threonine protein kinase